MRAPSVRRRLLPFFPAALAALGWLLPAGESPAQPLRPTPSASGSDSAPGPDASSSRPVPTTPRESALFAAKAGEYARAERELVALRSSDPEIQIALAHLMLEQGRFADADRYAGQVQGARRLEGVALRARVLHTQGKTKEALTLLEPHKDAAGHGGQRVRLALGEMLIEAGRRNDAKPFLMKFADEWSDDTITEKDPEAMGMLGRAMYLLGSTRDANDSFKKGWRADKENVELLRWHGELYLDKYDTGHAEESVRDALKISPKNPDLLVLMAHIKLEQNYDFDEADKLTKKALESNPKHPGAHAVRAGLALRDLDIDAAEKELALGFATNPNDTELWAMKGAVRFLADDQKGYLDAKKEALARNASFSRFFGIVAEFAEWEHRYDDIIVMMKEAVAIDPNDAKAWATLGLMQTRAGDETGGVQSLKEAWDKDHYNVRVLNTLDKLYEKWIPNEYAPLVQESVFKIRYPKDEQKVLERYVPQFLERAYGSMKMRYDFAPQLPVQVELYGNRQHFSVRTSGLPSIGIQGVCFGHMLASMSPRSEPFNWGNVLWHELGHVFAIQLSKNHVPRWFTEGLSEYETIVRRPEWRRGHDPELYDALTRNILPGAVEMNRAFTHSSEIDTTVAYYAASQMIIHTAERYGFSKIAEALRLWGDGARTEDVIKKAFGVTPKEYDEGFRSWALARLDRYRGQYSFNLKPKPLDEAKAAVTQSPTSAAAHVDYALALLRARKTEDAQREVAEAIRLDAKDKNAHYLAFKMAKEAPKKEEHLRAIQQAGGDGYAIQLALADIAEDKHDKGAQKAAFTRANRFDPTQSEPLKGLFDLAKEAHDEAGMLDALRKIAPLEQHDPKIWRLYLDKLVKEKLWDEARKVGESTLYVDIHAAPTHLSYARALAATGAHEKAVFELESALLCKPKPAEAGSAHALLARSYLALKDNAQAREHAEKAKELDPQNADLSGLQVP